MSTIFLDTSALAKRYVAEVGSGWLKAQIEPTAGNISIIAELAIVEMFSLLARKQREGHLALNDLLILQNNFLLHAKANILLFSWIAQSRCRLVSWLRNIHCGHSMRFN